MARYIGPSCKLCRRERTKLFLKGAKCETLKCPVERRPYPPGVHGRERTRQGSEYLNQLREKQKAKRTFGVSETAFRNYYKKASAESGITGERLIEYLETRLDNVVFRSGWASSRAQARQFVRHKHILVNSKVITIPSYQLSEGDVISLSEKARQFIVIRHNKDVISRSMPDWLSSSGTGFSVKVEKMPTRQDSDVGVKEQLIVELYSK